MHPDGLALLSPAERLAAYKLGATAVCAQAGIPKQAASVILRKVAEAGMLKAAQGVPGAGKALDMSWRLAASLALLTGVPAGYLAHSVQRQVQGETPEEKERLARIRYYRDVTRQLEQGLPATTA